MGGGACVPCLPRSVQHLTLLTTKENEQVSIMASRNKIQSRREELVVMHISTQATPPLRGHQVQMLFLVNRNKNLKKNCRHWPERLFQIMHKGIHKLPKLHI